MPPLELILDVLLYAVVPSAVTAAALLAIVVVLGGARSAPVGAALGLAGGAALGLWLRGALTLMPGASPWNRLPWAAALALVIECAARLPRMPLVAGWLARAACAVATAYWVIPESSRTETWWLAPAFAAVVFAQWMLLTYLADRPPGATVPACMSITAVVAGAVLIHAGSARLTDAATVLGASLAGLAVVAGWRRLDAGGALGGAAILLTGFLLMGQQETFSEIPWYVFALPVAAPLALAITLPMHRLNDKKLVLARLCVLLPALIVALELARQAAGPLEFE